MLSQTIKNTNIMEQVSIIPQKWQPFVGDETLFLLDNLKKLSEESKKILRNETLEILSNCADPKEVRHNQIGLVFGYVQSGKTMSFTTLTALAKDNGFPVIVVLAGVSTNLVDQSHARLNVDLQIDSRNDTQWLIIPNPKPNDKMLKKRVKSNLEEWKDSTIPQEDRRTILITVMKHKQHIPNLTKFIKDLGLEGIPVLIIDDEGDQHSMNRNAKQNAKKGTNTLSTIYKRIIELKNIIPNHSFVQYTATPQGPLFIEKMDSLSPNFIQLLTPGPDYTGGKIFFQENKEWLTKEITDIQHNGGTPVIPESLVYALQIFFLGVVKGLAKKDGGKRTMMIHPSQLTFTHGEYQHFVSNTIASFIDILSLPNGSPDKNDLLDEFRVAYDDLKATTDDLPSFEELTGDRLRHTINRTVMQSLNSNPGNKTIVDWRSNYHFILIGGTAMDRGFTVEGLTVTYMPRTIGVGNADTIQQRARFFGYKKSYLGYCRVYLDSEVLEAFTNYLVHEEDLRARLIAHKQSGEALNDWYRKVKLDRSLNLARSNIFSKEFTRNIVRNYNWIWPRTPHSSEYARSNNESVVRQFIDSSSFNNNRSRKFMSIEKPLAEIVYPLLFELKFMNPKDQSNYSVLLDTLEQCIQEDPEIQCTLFLMSDFDKPRERSLVQSSNEINQLFQGRNTKSEGLRDLKGEGITIQLYVLNLFEEGTTKDIPIVRNVPIVATYIPELLLPNTQNTIEWIDQT